MPRALGLASCLLKSEPSRLVWRLQPRLRSVEAFLVGAHYKEIRVPHQIAVEVQVH
jgi:hypothetical protein